MRSIVAVREELVGWAGELDPSTVTIGRARELLAEVAAIESIAATAKARLAARVAGAGGWRESGDRSAAHALARATGSTIGAAREALETGERLRQLPALAEAAASGVLSAGQVAAVAAVGAVAPDAVPALVDRAVDTTLADLREECARTLAVRTPDPEEQRRRIHADRSLRHWRTADGVGVLQVRDTPEVIAGVMTAITPAREALFAQARERDEVIRPDALDVDALVATVNAGANGGAGTDGAAPHRCAPRSKVIVRVDFDALLRGRPIDGEVCEIAGYAPIAVSAVRDMLATGDPFLTCVVTQGEQVCGVAHYGRKALAIQQTALEWTQPTCAADGCTQTSRLEIDHREAWAHRRITLTELLDRLCDHHHDLKTYQHWELVDLGAGRRRMLPPTDPRNPHHRRQREQARGDPPAA